MDAVTKVLGVTEEFIKSNDRSLDATRARGFYYTLCYENGLTYKFAGESVNRYRNLAWYGASSCKSYVRENLKAKEQLESMRRLIRGEAFIDDKDYEYQMLEPMFIKGSKYSVLDVTSKLLGEAYLGLKNDELLLHGFKRGDVVRELIKHSRQENG